MNPNPVFKVRPFFDAKYITNGYTDRRIGNRTQAFKWYHFQWRWVTSKPDFKVMVLLLVLSSCSTGCRTQCRYMWNDSQSRNCCLHSATSLDMLFLDVFHVTVMIDVCNRWLHLIAAWNMLLLYVIRACCFWQFAEYVRHLARTLNNHIHSQQPAHFEPVIAVCLKWLCYMLLVASLQMVCNIWPSFSTFVKVCSMPRLWHSFLVYLVVSFWQSIM